jgi:hypothetical protein
MDKKFNHQLSLIFAFLCVLIEFLTENINGNTLIIFFATIIASVVYYMVARLIIEVIEIIFHFMIK